MNVIDALQRALYQEIPFMGPVASALIAGFVVIVGGEIYLTPAGERYLAALDQERTE
jgi:hypothetical protein